MILLNIFGVKMKYNDSINFCHPRRKEETFDGNKQEHHFCIYFDDRIA